MLWVTLPAYFHAAGPQGVEDRGGDGGVGGFADAGALTRGPATGGVGVGAVNAGQGVLDVGLGAAQGDAFQRRRLPEGGKGGGQGKKGKRGSGHGSGRSCAAAGSSAA